MTIKFLKKNYMNFLDMSLENDLLILYIFTFIYWIKLINTNGINIVFMVAYASYSKVRLYFLLIINMLFIVIEVSFKMKIIE